MTFGAAIKSGFSNLTKFKGRARRSEFWWFYLFLVLVEIPFAFLSMIPLFAAIGSVGTVAEGDTLTDDQWTTLITGFVATYAIAIVLGIIVFLLMLSVWVRRLHDGGYSGHWLWFAVIGLGIIPLILAIFDGQRQTNQYGPDPKAGEFAQWPAAQPTYASPAPTPPPYIPPAAPVAQQAPPAPASGDTTDPFAAPPR